MRKDLSNSRRKIINKNKKNILSYLANNSIDEYILNSLSLIRPIECKNEWACLYPLSWYTKIIYQKSI